MKVKIISDGTVHGTKVVDEKTGEMLQNVVDIIWSAGMPYAEARAVVTLLRVPVELKTDVSLIGEEE